MEPAPQGQQHHEPTESSARDAQFNDWLNARPGEPEPTVPTVAQAHPGYGQFNAGVEMNRQLGIAAADRANRQNAGLPPRVHNLS